MEEERSEIVISVPTSTTVNDRTEDAIPTVPNQVSDDELAILLKSVFIL